MRKHSIDKPKERNAMYTMSSPMPIRALTARERDVVRLVASGASNRDTARVLRLSVRTVENHLQSVYGKLGISSRTKLAVALLRGNAELRNRS